MEALGLSSAGYTKYLHRCTEDMRTTDKYRAEVAAEYYRRLKGLYGVELADEMVADAKHYVKFLYSLPVQVNNDLENMAQCRTSIANLFADGATMLQARIRNTSYRSYAPAWDICRGSFSYSQMYPIPRAGSADYGDAHRLAEELSQELSDFPPARAEYTRIMSDVLTLLQRHNETHEAREEKPIRKQIVTLIADIVGFAVNPFTVIESTPLDKYYAGLDCLSRQFPGKVSTAHKSPVVSKRVAKKIGSHIQWLLKAIGKDKHPLATECVSVFATFWNKALPSVTEIQMVNGDDIIAVYADNSTYSCMCKNGKGALSLYAANPDKVKQLVRYSSEGAVQKRMMIFDAGLRTKNGEVVWCLDREYGSSNNSVQDITSYYIYNTNMDVCVLGEDEGTYPVAVRTYSVYYKGRTEKILATLAYESICTIFKKSAAHVPLTMPVDKTQYIPYMDTWARFESNCYEGTVALYHISSTHQCVNGLPVAQNTSTDTLNVKYWLDGNDDDDDEDEDEECHEGEVWSDRYGEYIDEVFAVYVSGYGYITTDDEDFVYCDDSEEYCHINDTFYCSSCGQTYSDMDRYNTCIISDKAICDDCGISIYYWNGQDVDEGYASEYHASRAACFSAGDEEHMAAFIEYLGGDPDEPLYVSRYDRTKFMDKYAAFIEDYVESEQEEACEMLA